MLPTIPRRRLLLGLGAVLLGCAPSAPPDTPRAAPPAPAPPDREVGALTELLTAVGLDWLVLLEPARILSLIWLRPALARVLQDERFDALATTSGVDLRVASTIALAGYGDTVAYWLRHRAEQALLRHRFRARLTSGHHEQHHGHQLDSVWGLVGRSPLGLVTVGPDVAGFQYGGEEKKGPGRVAVLYALGKLGEFPKVAEDPVLQRLEATLGAAPARLYLRGPFEGPATRGLRGLLAATEGLGLALTPVEPQLQLDVILEGDFGPEPPTRFVELAWRDLVVSDLGHLLGLPEAAEAFAEGGRLRLRALLDPQALAAGLAAATLDDARAIMAPLDTTPSDPPPSGPSSGRAPHEAGDHGHQEGEPEPEE
ncbi:MAG: hypothetical protein R3B72_22150 [Polyangiaceae bacterium]